MTVRAVSLATHIQAVAVRAVSLATHIQAVVFLVRFSVLEGCFKGPNANATPYEMIWCFDRLLD